MNNILQCCLLLRSGTPIINANYDKYFRFFTEVNATLNNSDKQKSVEHNIHA